MSKKQTPKTVKRTAKPTVDDLMTTREYLVGEQSKETEPAVQAAIQVEIDKLDSQIAATAPPAEPMPLAPDEIDLIQMYRRGKKVKALLAEEKAVEVRPFKPVEKPSPLMFNRVAMHLVTMLADDFIEPADLEPDEAFDLGQLYDSINRTLYNTMLKGEAYDDMELIQLLNYLHQETAHAYRIAPINREGRAVSEKWYE